MSKKSRDKKKRARKKSGVMELEETQNEDHNARRVSLGPNTNR